MFTFESPVVSAVLFFFSLFSVFHKMSCLYLVGSEPVLGGDFCYSGSFGRLLCFLFFALPVAISFVLLCHCIVYSAYCIVMSRISVSWFCDHRVCISRRKNRHGLWGCWMSTGIKNTHPRVDIVDRRLPVFGFHIWYNCNYTRTRYFFFSKGFDYRLLVKTVRGS